MNKWTFRVFEGVDCADGPHQYFDMVDDPTVKVGPGTVDLAKGHGVEELKVIFEERLDPALVQLMTREDGSLHPEHSVCVLQGMIYGWRAKVRHALEERESEN